MSVACFYGDILLVPLRNLEDPSLSVRRGCVLRILSIALRTWMPSPPSSTAKCAIPSYRLNTRVSKYSLITNFYIASIYNSKNLLLLLLLYFSSYGTISAACKCDFLLSRFFFCCFVCIFLTFLCCVYNHLIAVVPAN